MVASLSDANAVAQEGILQLQRAHAAAALTMGLRSCKVPKCAADHGELLVLSDSEGEEDEHMAEDERDATLQDLLRRWQRVDTQALRHLASQRVSSRARREKELEKKRKQYSDPQSRQNLSKLNESLEVRRGGKSETERVEREKVKRGEESEKARALRE